MKKYAHLDYLKEQFLKGNFDFDEKKIEVNGVEFQFLGETSKYSLLEIMEKNYKPMVAYNMVASKENEDNANNMNRWIVFLWGMNDNLQIVPYDVRNLSKSRAGVPIREATKEVEHDRIIADKVNVKMIDLPVANDIVAKVDTGAEITSLHATDIQINRSTQGNTVSFNAPDLSNNRFTLPLVSQQPVKVSNGDTSNRPVIKLTMKIKNKVLKDILVNLNDRSKMDDPMLLGQNALEAGNFIVDPNLLSDGEIFSSEFIAEVANERVAGTSIDPEQAREIYETLSNARSVTLDDLLKIMRTEILNNIDDITY